MAKGERFLTFVRNDRWGDEGITTLIGGSDLLALPAAAFEEDDADGGHGRFGHDDGPVDAVGVHARVNGQEIGERDFQHPEGKEIDDGGCDGVAGAVKGLQHNHGIGVADVA